MKLEVFQSPMRVAWHWRVTEGDRILAMSPSEGYAEFSKMLDAIDDLAAGFKAYRMTLVKLDECPPHWRENYDGSNRTTKWPAHNGRHDAGGDSQ